MTDDGTTDELLDAGERAHFTHQLSRLNDNIERQFQLIEHQRAAERTADRRAGRRRWAVVGIVAMLIVGGNVRLEMVRAEQRTNDQQQLAQILREQCRRTNKARTETRGAIDAAFAAVEDVAPDDAKEPVRQAGDQVHDELAQALPTVDCSRPLDARPVDAYDSCSAAAADGASPLIDGDAGWNPALDGDGDGIACE